MEVASFYTCDETWNQEDEISLLIQETYLERKIMSDYKLSDILDDENTKIIYVYDFINMWTFLVELAAIEEQEAETYILKRCSLMVKCQMKQWKKALKLITRMIMPMTTRRTRRRRFRCLKETIALKILGLKKIGINL
jgi:hypothetical protein